MATKDLIARWQSTIENDRASERIFDIFKRGGVLSMENSPFGRLERDLIDFRGYPAHRILVKDVTLKDIDLSFADFSSCRMEANRFENCLFEKTDFTHATDHGDTFDHCIFVNCKFKLAVLGYEGSQYRNCLFKECEFQRTNFIRPEFIHTEFKNCRLKSIDFNASSFENCKFEGLLDDVWFRGTFPPGSQMQAFGKPKINKMENVSFERADLVGLTLSDGCDLSTVKLKNDGRYLKYDKWLKRLQYLDNEIANWKDDHHKREIERYLKVSMVHAQNQEWEILNINDLEKDYGGKETASKIISVLNGFRT